MIKFACGRCGRLIRVDAKYAGKKGKCPKCGNIVTVPKESTIISFLCGQCGHQIEVPEVHAGKKGKCPKCGNAVVVPARKEKPIDGAEVVAVTCSMCGKIIESAGSSQGPVLECPACGAYLESSSGALSTQSDGSVPPEADEEYGEESVGTAGRSAGPDRRLVVLIAAAAAVVIVGGVVLFTVLRSSGSRATRGSNPLSGEQEVVAADRPAPAVAPAVSRQASEPSLGAKDAEMQRLQFRPAPGTKRTVQLTTKATTSAKEGGQPQDMTSTETVDFDLEVMEPLADGVVAVNVSLAAIRQTSEAQGQVLGAYDSTQPPAQGDSLAEMYTPYLAHPFTVKVSPRGEIVDPGLDGLFRAAAERLAQREDDALRERLKGKAEQAIQRTNERFGSRENRVLALKKQLEEFPILGRVQLSGLVSSLMVALPDKPLCPGDTWEGPLTIGMGPPMPMAGTYTLTAVEQDACTIRATGRRSEDEDPVVEETKQMKVSNKLAGSSEATLRLDRRIGWLLSKEHKTSLHGQITMTAAGPPSGESASEISIEIASTLTTIR